VVVVPLGLWEGFAESLSGQYTGNGSANVLGSLSVDGSSVNIELVCLPQLTWTEKFAVFRGGGQALIRQEEVEPYPMAKAEGSDYEFDNKAWQFALESSRNAGYGRWQHAVLNTLI
jgi:hypothetical protein